MTAEPVEKDAITRLFHALGDPTRRKMVEMLSERPHSVSALAGALGITLTAVGQHLALLEACGMARTEKLGRVRVCSIDRAGLTMLQAWIEQRRSPVERSLDRLGELLDEQEEQG